MLGVLAAFLLFSFVSALMLLSDLAEEYPSRFRFLLKSCILLNLVAHTLILCVDRMFWVASVVSLLLNVGYMRVFLRTYPWVPSITDVRVTFVCLGILCESALWYFQCVHLINDYYMGTPHTIGFMSFLWLVPIILLASCVVEDERLPGMPAGGGGGNLGHAAAAPERKKTLFNRLIGVFKN
ncbi:hypothetical protein STCU_02345 [Strigomonas culicis]|uniref:Transmembrane adaptor Erv26 n=1 Tax=Strigomonas culicis TaxID=28005 RepID=S9UWM7_9TRYP|nr:hypothetical protein STCU_02345 [Strigomonas culicis]|eukprot:EPY33283.1 hypothetical protein STCU_02345 [Strigomonas culicis]